MTVPRRVAGRGGATSVFGVTFAAVFLVQCAWILALPAFHGIDEFDHVYRAASAATGQVLPSSQHARHGRGNVVRVPAAVVGAAGPVCASYPYTGRDNCRPIKHLAHGQVEIATAASAYNPVYYVVFGTLARPFHGAAFDYALRVLTAAAGALLLAWGAVVTARWSRDAWPLGAYALASTPVLLYSTSIAAPNGLEYSAALLLWTSGIALVRDPGRPKVVPLVVAALLLPALHTTGAMWLLFASGALLLLQPWAQWRAMVTRLGHRRAMAAVAVIGVGALACVAWILLAHTNAPDADGRVGPGHPPSLGVLVAQNVLWPLQAVAAYPMRDQPAPTVVYAALVLPLLALLVVGWRAAGPRVRAAIALVVVATVVVPSVLTWSTYGEMGTAWQGRYTLPLYVGLPLLAAHALTGERRLRASVRAAVVCCVGLGYAVSVAHVARVLVAQRPGTSAAQLVPAGWLAVSALAGLGSMALAWSLVRYGNTLARTTPTARTPVPPTPARAAVPVA